MEPGSSTFSLSHPLAELVPVDQMPVLYTWSQCLLYVKGRMLTLCQIMLIYFIKAQKLFYTKLPENSDKAGERKPQSENIFKISSKQRFGSRIKLCFSSVGQKFTKKK